jgi:hypothetical protein
MKRRAMSRRQSKKSFRRGTRVSGRNSYRPMRGGIRI